MCRQAEIADTATACEPDPRCHCHGDAGMTEKLVNENSIPYRNDNKSGPKYLLRGPNVDFGMILLLPGEDLAAHYHSVIEENFFTPEGEADIFIKEEKTHMVPGDLMHVPAKAPHYLINASDKPWKAIIVKAPFDPKDKTDIAWKPGQNFDDSLIH